MSELSPFAAAPADPAAISGRRLVCFLLGEQEFAINIEHVREVTELLPLAPIPRAPAGIRGVITIRGRALVLVDLHALFEMPVRERSAGSSRQVVIEGRGYVFAIEVDTMAPLRWLPRESQLEPSPAGAGAKGSYVEAIMIQGELPVMLLDVDRIANDSRLQAALAASRDQQLRAPFSIGQDDTAAVDGEGHDRERGLVCFRLGDQEYAVPIERGQEVVAPLPITFIPFGPPFLRGVINLRGSILPLLDLRVLLSLGSGAASEDAERHLVIGDEWGTVAIVVDAVTRLRRARPSVIDPVPPSMAHDGVAYLEGIIPDETRPVLVLDWSKVMNHEAITRLRRGAGAAGDV